MTPKNNANFDAISTR